MQKIFDSKGDCLEAQKEELMKNPEFSGMDIPDYLVLPLTIYLEDISKCKRCKGIQFCKQRVTGYAPILGNDLRVSYKACKHQKEEEMRRKNRDCLQALYLPKKILEASIDDFHLETEERKNCLGYASQFISSISNGTYFKGMFLSGYFGSGKTYLLAAIANELAKRNINTILIYFPDLVSDLKGNLEKLNEKMDMIKDVDVLMLDDFGSESMSAWVRDAILAPILNYRVLAEKPVFFSSNMKIAECGTYLTKIDNDKLKAGRICKRIEDLCEFYTLGGEAK